MKLEMWTTSSHSFRSARVEREEHGSARERVYASGNYFFVDYKAISRFGQGESSEKSTRTRGKVSTQQGTTFL